MNLKVLEKLAEAGVEIKVSNRLHARFFVTYYQNPKQISKYSGLLVIGSFDFNKDCIGLERYDAGVKTRHPDLVKSAVILFDQIWNEHESIPLEDFIQKQRK